MEQKQMQTNAVAMMTAVNFSEMKISRNPAETLVAFSIGTGMGLAVFDPGCGVGGILNFMLPDSTLASGVDLAKVPLMFADTGRFRFQRRGVNRSRLILTEEFQSYESFPVPFFVFMS